jgi:uncharacterized protein
VSQLIVPVAELLGQPGEYRDIRISEPLPGVRTALARLSGDPIGADLRAESVIEGILVTGRVEGATILQCSRCLEEFGSHVELRVCELFSAPGREAEEDAYEITGAEIRLEPMLVDAVTLALPLYPLCRDDCWGLCASCGADLNAGPCGCVEEDSDPRWAALDEIRGKLEDRGTA